MDRALRARCPSLARRVGADFFYHRAAERSIHPLRATIRPILLSFMADRFDVMTVWIENVGRKIIRVMFETEARCAIITATGRNRRFVNALTWARLETRNAI